MPRGEVVKTRKGRAGVAKNAVQRDAGMRAAAKVVTNQMPTKALKYQMKTLSDPLTHQDIAVISYLHTIGDPWVEDPAGVPLLAGTALVRRTVKAQLKFEVQAVANGFGFAFVAVNCDGWNGSANTQPIRFASYPTGSQGYPISYSSSTSFAGANFPVWTTSQAATPAGMTFVRLPSIDGQITANSNIRLVAAGIRVFSDASVTLAQGKLAVFSTTRPYSTDPANGAIAGSSYSTLSTMPTDVLSFQSEPCAGWKAGHSLYAVAIPSDPTCFEMFNPPSSGTDTFSFPQLGACLAGAAVGQTFTAQIVYDYEFDVGVNYLTGVDSDPVIGVSASNLSPYVAQMHPHKIGKDAFNAGAGAKAFLTHTALTRPALLPAIVKPSGGILEGIGGAAKAALGWAAKSGLGYVKSALKNIPAVGAVMSVLGL